MSEGRFGWLVDWTTGHEQALTAGGAYRAPNGDWRGAATGCSAAAGIEPSPRA